MDEVAINIHTG